MSFFNKSFRSRGPVSIVLSVIISVLFVALIAEATTIGTNINTAGTLTVSGASALSSTLTVGVDATGYDVKFFGDTASKFMVWDESVDNLILADAVGLQLGGDESTLDGFILEFDGTSTLNIDAFTANNGMVIGASTSTDWTLTGASGNTAWDASASSFTINGADTTTSLAITDGNVVITDSLSVTGTTTLSGRLIDSSGLLEIATGGADSRDFTVAELQNRIIILQNAFGDGGGITMTLDGDNILAHVVPAGGSVEFILINQSGETITIAASDNATAVSTDLEIVNNEYAMITIFRIGSAYWVIMGVPTPIGDPDVT